MSLRTYLLLADRKLRLEKDEVTIGRSETCDVNINSILVSRKHALLRREWDAWYLTHLGAFNSTWINNTLSVINVATRLKHGDFIYFASKDNQAIFYEQSSQVSPRKHLNPTLSLSVGKATPEVQALKDKLKEEQLRRSELEAMLVKKEDELQSVNESWATRLESKEKDFAAELAQSKNRLIDGLNKLRTFYSKVTEKQEKASTFEKQRLEKLIVCKEAQKSMIEAKLKAHKDKAAKNESVDSEATTFLQNMMGAVQSELCCAVCSEIFIEPVTTECGHSFCNYCLSRWLVTGQRYGSNCPSCRSVTEQKTRNHSLEAYIEKVVPYLPKEVRESRSETIAERSRIMAKKRNNPMRGFSAAQPGQIVESNESEHEGALPGSSSEVSGSSNFIDLANEEEDSLPSPSNFSLSSDEMATSEGTEDESISLSEQTPSGEPENSSCEDDCYDGESRWSSFSYDSNFDDCISAQSQRPLRR